MNHDKLEIHFDFGDFKKVMVAPNEPIWFEFVELTLVLELNTGRSINLRFVREGMLDNKIFVVLDSSNIPSEDLAIIIAYVKEYGMSDLFNKSNRKEPLN
jgi:hypothetical protein